MKKHFYLAISSTLLIGFLAGFGATSLIKIGLNHFNQYRAEQRITSVDFTRNLGGPDGDTRYTQTERLRFLNREISYSAKPFGYGKIDAEMSLPKLTAKSFLIADLDTGDLIDGHNIDEPLPIASLTKLLTTMIAIQNYKLEDEVWISGSAINTYGQQGNLYKGEKISVLDLLYATLLTSSNDAAEALAEFAGRKNFLAWMNTEASYINMADSEFFDASGLSAKNISSPADLFELTSYIYKNHPEILEITALKSYRGERQTWYNNSRFRNDEKYLGGKNGYTDEAIHTLISLFELPIGENSESRNVAIIVLGSQNAEKDVRALKLYLLQNIEYVSQD